MSTKPSTQEERNDYRTKRAQWEAFGACVPKEGVVNVTNHSHEKPTTHSVFIDLWDGDAVSCSCKDWKHRKPAGGCKHVRFVNDHDALLIAASTPDENEE